MKIKFTAVQIIILLVTALSCSDMIEKYKDGVIGPIVPDYAITGSVIVNDDDTYCIDRRVTLSFDVVNAEEMQISEDGETWSEWETFTSSYSYTLLEGNGLHDVQVNLRNSHDEEHAVNDDIIFTEELVRIYDGGNSLQEDKFGYSVDMSDDGTVIAVGIPEDNGDLDAFADDQGAVHVYSYNGTYWSEQRIVLSKSKTKDYAGYSISLSGDGTRLLIGSYERDSSPLSSDNKGAAFIYDLDSADDTWKCSAELAESSWTIGDRYGYAVGLSGDGNTAAVGSIFADGTCGAVAVYRLQASTWNAVTTLSAEDPEVGDLFGSSIAVSNNGNIIVVGAPERIQRKGSFMIFDGSAGWARSEIKNTSGSTGDFLGSCVAVNSAGTVVASGARKFEHNGNDEQGAVFVVRYDGSWNTENPEQLYASDGQAYDQFGRSVALSSDGSRLVVGAFYDQEGFSDQGSVYPFAWDGSEYVQGVKLTALDCEAQDELGVSLALSADGTIAAAGADLKDGTDDDQGFVYIFRDIP